MKRTVLVFGLIAGAMLSLMMAATLPFIDRIGFDKAEILGYTTMIASFLMIYVGIRSYRDNVAGGSITFKRALALGLLITLISCACYVATWELLYFNVESLSGFMDKYAAYIVEQAKASGASAEAIDARMKQMASFKELYENPFFNMAMTFTEPLPVGFVISLISAAILRKKLPAAP